MHIFDTRGRCVNKYWLVLNRTCLPSIPDFFMMDVAMECTTCDNPLGLIPGPRFKIKMSSYQYRKSHCGDKTVVRSSYLHNGISYTGKMLSLYWIGAQGIPGQLHQYHGSWCPGSLPCQQQPNLWLCRTNKPISSKRNDFKNQLWKITENVNIFLSFLTITHYQMC